MKILALHGFLGQAKDWDSLKERLSSSDVQYDWECPELFHPDSALQLNTFASTTKSLFESLVHKKYDLIIGYSFGGRIALELLKAQPEIAKTVLLLSTHLGFARSEDRIEKRQKDSQWALRFLSDPWKEVSKNWEGQKIFAKDQRILRNEQDFDRRKLYQGLENLSSSEQQPLLTWDLALQEKLCFAVGHQDQKYMTLYENYKKAGWLKEYHVLPGGHRLHAPASNELAELVNQLKM